MKVKLTNFAFLLHNISFSQTTMVFEDWQSTHGSQQMDMKAKSVTDEYGNAYVAGTTLNGSGDYDALVVKYDSHGDVLWSVQYDIGINLHEIFSAIYVDAHCNVFLTGSGYQNAGDSSDVLTVYIDSSGSMQWHVYYDGADQLSDGGTDIVFENDSIYVSGVETDSAELSDFLCLKYDLGGNLVWANTFDDHDLEDISTAIVRVSSGEVLIAGAAQTDTLDWDYLTVKFNAGTGSLVTSNTTGGGTAGFDYVTGMVKDNAGNVYITGASFSIYTGFDFLTLKLDDSLQVVWSSTYNSGGLATNVSNAIARDTAGNIYVTGFTDSTGQGMNYTTIKYNSSGTQQWVRHWNDSENGNDTAKAITIDNDGDIIITGTSWNGSDEDYYTIKYDPSGNILWEIPFNSKYSKTDRALTIANDEDGNVFVTGQSKDTDSTYQYITLKYIEVDISMPPDTEAVSGSISFIQNNDQLLGTDSNLVERVRFYTNQTSPSLYFMDDTLSYVFASIDGDTATIDSLARIDMWFEGDQAKILPLNKADYYYNYYMGHLTEGRARTPLFKSLYKPQAFSRIDVLHTTNDMGHKIDFIVQPGGDPSSINMNFAGYDSLFIRNDSLFIQSEIQTVSYERPKAFQDSLGIFIPLTWQPKFALSGNTIVFDSIGSWNHSYDLYFKMNWGTPGTPTQQAENLCWSTYIGGGGSGDEHSNAITVDADGRQYITGVTSSANFPIYMGFQSTLPSGYQCFMAGFKPNHARKFVTFCGGNESQNSYDVKCKSTNEIYFCGHTISSNFPTYPETGATNLNYSGVSNSFIAKLDSMGIRKWVTCFPPYRAYSLDFDINRNLYIVGYGGSGSMTPTSMGGAYNHSYFGGTYDAYIAKFNNNDSLIWSTWFGGSGMDYGKEVKIDSQNSVFMLCTTNSNNFETQWLGGGSYCDSIFNGNFDDALVKFSSTGTLLSSNYIGGSGNEAVTLGGTLWVEGGNRIAFDSNRNIFIVGSTESSDFPIQTSWGFNDTTFAGHDGYIMQFSGQDLALWWSTYISGVGEVDFSSIILFPNDNFMVSGSTSDPDFPLHQQSGVYYQDTLWGIGSDNLDGCIIGFTKNYDIMYSTFFGGYQTHNYGEFIKDMALYGESLYITGYTTTQGIPGETSFPLFDPGNGAFFDSTFSGGWDDAFIALICTDLIDGMETNKTRIPFNSISIFPNPSSTEISIEFLSETNSEIMISYYNCLGQQLGETIQSVSVGKNKIQKNILVLPPGLYFITISGNNINSSAKFIKM